MSGSKDVLMSWEELRAKTRPVLRRAGVLEQCEFHGTYFDTGIAPEPAYPLGNWMISNGKIDLGGFSRREFTDAMKQEYEDHITLDGCPDCAHAMAD